MNIGCKTYNPGDPVVYQVTKHSSRPGGRAESISPSAHGDYYTYTIKKFWRVVRQTPEGSVVVRTRRGKQRILSPGDPSLHRVSWWERIAYRSRFPVEVEED